MLYRINQKNGYKLSLLGFGCMRFPRKGNKIDQELVNGMVTEAINCGINFFDTAYIYPGAEEALGKAFEATGNRELVNIGTKLPHYMCKKTEDFDRIFTAQQERLRTDWFDYYFIHMLSNKESWERVKALGIEQWVDKKREEGKIRNLGFSYHGGREQFLELIDAYDWDFCMVQYNYFDQNDQATAAGVRQAHEKGIPVFVMEPLRGGLLASRLPEAAKKVFIDVHKERSPAEWAFRWLFDQLEVTMVLSGMTEAAQITENSALVDDAGLCEVSDAEREAYAEVVKILQGSAGVPCTACGYCLPCPKGVDIPGCFSCYNNSLMLGRSSGIAKYFQVTGQLTPNRSDASKCNECGVCRSHCPQSIDIPAELKVVKRRLWSAFIIPLMGFARLVLRIKGNNPS